LRRLKDEGPRYFGSHQVQLSVMTTEEREASQVARIRVAGETDVSVLYLKRYKPRENGDLAFEQTRRQVERDFDMTRRVHRALAGCDRFAAVRAIACFPEDLVLVTAEVPGRTLSDVIEQQASWKASGQTVAYLRGVLERVGAWLRAFQAIDVEAGALSMTAMREYIDVRLRRLRALTRPVISVEERDAVLRHFDRSTQQLADSDLVEVLVHADLAPSNIMVDGDHVAVIDFAMAARSGVYMDVARLYTQLEFLTAKPQFRQSVVGEMQHALLDGFERGLSLDRPLFRLFVIQHLLCHMSSLARNPAPRLAAIYNTYQLHRHRTWLRRLVQ
jgi:tRNA A-37 threonylcarbamoyl transferase component Bud32